jgi:hypothetical protein
MDTASVPNPRALSPRPRFDDLLPRLMEESESHERRKLLREARAGSAGALCLLWERYRLRLPLVEARVPFTFPWMRASPGNPRRRGRRRGAGAGLFPPRAGGRSGRQGVGWGRGGAA